MKLILILAVVLLLPACEQVAIQEPSNDPVANFELFWREFDRYYSYFEQKNVDWDSVYAVYRPRAERATSSNQLLDIFAELCALLRDNHVAVNSPLRNIYFDQAAGYPANAPTFAQDYFTESMRTRGKLAYATIGDLGYIRVSTFQGTPGEFDGINEIMEALREKSGIIIDTRNHDGGDDTYGELIAGRFADQRRRFRYNRFRNGPNHSDFSPWQESYIEPTGTFQFTKPVAALTNRSIFSAGEGFVMMLRTLPHVTLIGGQSGGSIGRPLFRELPNGWTYWLSSGMAADPVTQEVIIDSIGTLPDIEVHITPEDSAARRDTILERAIRELGG